MDYIKSFNKSLAKNLASEVDIYGVSEKNERVPLKKSQKDEIFLLNQKGKCARCNKNLVKEGIIPPDFHHKDGNPSNNNPKNIEAICPNCHRKETFKQWRNKPIQKPKTQKAFNPLEVKIPSFNNPWKI